MNDWLKVFLEKDESHNIFVQVPNIKGCYSQGRNIKEAVKNIEDVIGICTETQHIKVLDKERQYVFRLKNFSKTIKNNRLTALIKLGERQFVALCPELDVVSQGKNLEIALKNLIEAVELFEEAKKK